MARRGCAGRTAAKKPVGEGPGERVQGWVQNADCQQPLHRREPRGERDQSRGLATGRLGWLSRRCQALAPPRLDGRGHGVLRCRITGTALSVEQKKTRSTSIIEQALERRAFGDRLTRL